MVVFSKKTRFHILLPVREGGVGLENEEKEEKQSRQPSSHGPEPVAVTRPTSFRLCLSLHIGGLALLLWLPCLIHT